MTLSAALVAPVIAVAAAAAPVPAAEAPCAACVTWRGTAEDAGRLLDPPGRLDGLDVLVVVEPGESPSKGAAVSRALGARGAVVGLELPLDAALPAAPPGVSRVVLRLPSGTRAADELVYRVRTRATALRAAAPGVAVGLSAPPSVLSDLATRGIAPYVSLLVASEDGAVEGPDGFEWWTPITPVGEGVDGAATVAGLIAETTQKGGRRRLAAITEGTAAAARRLARLAQVLPHGLTPLAAVEVCAPGGAACARPTFLHPRTLDAIAIVDAPTTLQVRPGAARAVAHPLDGGEDVTLPVTAREAVAQIDAQDAPAPFVLRVQGWAGEAAFATGLEVEAERSLTVEEVVAAHQAAAARQAALVATLIATGHTVLTFQVPGLPAPMTVTGRTVIYRRGELAEIEQDDLRLNGVPVAVGTDGVPRLPLVQPEKVASPPLALSLGDLYRYRLLGQDEAASRRCYVVGFTPADPGRPSFQGRAWIARDGFALVRVEATQTGLRGAIVSSRQTDEMRPLIVAGHEAWLPARSEVEQVYEGPAHRTPIRRQVTFDRLEANPAGFEARLAAARASRSVMLRETWEGLRYLRRVPLPPGAEARARTAAGAEAAPAVVAGRALAGRATRVWSLAAGALFDPNIDGALPFAGLGYLDFDVLGTGAQMSAFLAGPFVQAAVAVPSVGGPGLQLHATAFASLAGYNDRSFRGGIERYEENLRQRPARASVSALKRLGGRARLRLAYDLDAVRLEGNDTTAADFRVPPSPVAHGLRLGLEWEAGPWSATAWSGAWRRQRWRDWGHPGDYSPEARAYQRAGLSLVRTFVLSPRAVARVEGTALAGRHLDRFSRFGFDGFDERLRGYPSAGVRFDRGAIVRTAATFTALPGLRLDAFADAALVRDPEAGPGARRHLGLGAAVEAALPGRVLLSLDWGFGAGARDREGRRGTHVVRITAFRIL